MFVSHLKDSLLAKKHIIHLKKKKKSVTGPVLTVIRGLLICTFDYRYRSFEPSVHSFLDLLWKPCSIIHNWKRKFWSGRDGVTFYWTEMIILTAGWPLASCNEPIVNKYAPSTFQPYFHQSAPLCSTSPKFDRWGLFETYIIMRPVWGSNSEHFRAKMDS